jgi:ribosomal-protein-serine acetyltransferase
MSDPILLDVPREIRTPRLTLHAIGEGDGPRLEAAFRTSLAELSPWLPWAKDDYAGDKVEAWCRGAAARFITRDGCAYAVVEDSEFIGGCGLHDLNWKHRTGEIGYWLRTDRTGRGYMTECVVALRDAFVPTLLRRVEIRCDVRNAASAAVARGAGFVHEGTKRCDSLGTDGLPRDTDFFGYVAA